MNLIIHLNRINYVNAIKDGVLIFLTYENAKAGEVVNKKELTKQRSELRFCGCIVYGSCAYIIRDILGHADIEAKKVK